MIAAVLAVGSRWSLPALFVAVIALAVHRRGAGRTAGRRGLAPARAGRRAPPPRSPAPPVGSAPVREGRSGGGGPTAWVALAAAALGRSIRRVWGAAPEPAADRAAGAMVLAGAAGALASPLLGVVAAGTVPLVGLVRRRARRRRARAALVAELPDVVDLFRVAGRAGATPVVACASVARHGSGAIVDVLGGVIAAVGAGRPFVVALDDLRDLGDPLLPLVDALVATERDGAPLLAALDRVAADARLERRRRAEESARAVPVRLLFPLVLCTLPAFGLLTVVPLLVRSLADLAG